MKQKTTVDILILFLLLFVFFFVYGDRYQIQNVDLDEAPQFYENMIATPYIPKNISFAGEEVPIEIYWVREALDKELTINCYQHSRTLQIFKKSGRYFPIIEKILKEEEIPEDFKYLCVAESGLENVVSPVAAAGFWQFMETTGKNYGLEINSEVDERYDIEKATRAACQYIKGCKERLGSWSLAAAAYNMGEAGVGNAISNQQSNDYWDLYLNSETARYLYRIISYKLLFEKPRQYGIVLKNVDLYYPIPYEEVSVKSTILDLYKFAQEHNILYRELKALNPWLRDSKLTVKNKNYIIKIPQKTKLNYQYLYKDLKNPFDLLGDSVFHVE